MRNRNFLNILAATVLPFSVLSMAFAENLSTHQAQEFTKSVNANSDSTLSQNSASTSDFASTKNNSSDSMSSEIKATEIVDRMAQAIRRLGRYEVVFQLKNLDLSGNYIVDGDNFMLSLSGQQVYGDGILRYAIDHNNREIIIEETSENALPMIMLNPAIGLLSLNDVFEAQLVKEDVSSLSLDLKPKDSNLPLERTRLELSAEDYLPQKVSYFADGDVVELVFKSISTENVKPLIPIRDLPRPKGYDIIDLR